MQPRVLITLFVLAAACIGCSRSGEQPGPASATKPPLAPDLPAGAYEIDLSHASLLFRVNHLGFSNYTARFKRLGAQLQFDPRNLASSTLNVSVDASSIETDFPDPAKLD